VTSGATDYIAISPAYRSTIQRWFPVDMKRDGLAVSYHVLYVIALSLLTNLSSSDLRLLCIESTLQQILVRQRSFGTTVFRPDGCGPDVMVK